MKIRMAPSPESVGGESGIKTVVRKYAEHLREFGVDIVPDSAETYDLTVTHAGMRQVEQDGPVYAHLHGLYWTADYPAQTWQLASNSYLVQNIRHATGLSVPSEWVAEVIKRDMRFIPDVLPHGVDWKEWRHDFEHEGYALWAKNRVADVCDPGPTAILAKAFPKTQFVNTFAPWGAPKNIQQVGVMEHSVFRKTLQKAGVYLSLTKETFGVATLEALASGTPVLGWAIGGNVDIIEHGVTGYLVQPGDHDDLVAGMRYIMQYRKDLSANAREAAKKWTWQAACEKVAQAYQAALARYKQPPTVALVIPVWNKPVEMVERAILSGLKQTHIPEEIIVVDDGSTAHKDGELEELCSRLGVRLERKSNGGVATARNHGARCVPDVKYLSFLDADDAIEPDFLETCISSLEEDTSIHIAYTKLLTLLPDGRSKISNWPGEWSFDAQIARKNQVPTANVMRAETFHRLGGYRQRYAPKGAGSEDAELWTRFGAYGYGAKLVDNRPLFVYSFGAGLTAQQGYSEADWLVLHPWVKDHEHPFASHAKPQNGRSHLVRQYDEPVISVVIPVGPGHGEEVLNALDSLDAQTYRKWECIVVEDGEEIVPQWIKKTFPHVRWERLPERKGAGAARNYGADVARGGFLFFLDADDHIVPSCFMDMLDEWGNSAAIVYSDYKGIVNIENADELIKQISRDPFRSVLAYDGKTMVIHHDSARRFDCDKALRQPENPPYIWCLVSCLIPTVWHKQIGGFDESLDSWEDVDYHWRLAKSGHCYARVQKDLVVYRFDTGQRRESGRQIASKLLQYLTEKHSQQEYEMGCGCNGNKGAVSVTSEMARFVESQGGEMATLQSLDRGAIQVNDADLVRIRYNDPRAGAHRVIGSQSRIDYGRRSGGEIFFVHRDDVYIPDGRGGTQESMVFAPIRETVPAREVIQPPPPPPAKPSIGPILPKLKITGTARVTDPEPEPAAEEASDEFDLTSIKGIGPATAKKVAAAGIVGISAIIKAGEPGLREAGLTPEQAKEVFTQALSGG